MKIGEGNVFTGMCLFTEVGRQSNVPWDRPHGRIPYPGDTLLQLLLTSGGDH